MKAFIYRMEQQDPIFEDLLTSMFVVFNEKKFISGE
jgi:hypothetical protein